MARPLRVQIGSLALLVTACLPPDPFDAIDTSDDFQPDEGCWDTFVEVGPSRWQLEHGVSGRSTTPVPGELAAAELEITLSDWASEHLLDMHLELSVVAGQALPGQALILQQGSEPLQEAKLGGTHGNEAHFDVALARDLCGTPCTLSLSLSGPPALSNVPVPLRMNGSLSAFLDSTRKRRPCSEYELTAVVTDAP